MLHFLKIFFKKKPCSHPLQRFFFFFFHIEKGRRWIYMNFHSKVGVGGRRFIFERRVQAWANGVFLILIFFPHNKKTPLPAPVWVSDGQTDRQDPFQPDLHTYLSLSYYKKFSLVNNMWLYSKSPLYFTCSAARYFGLYTTFTERLFSSSDLACLLTLTFLRAILYYFLVLQSSYERFLPYGR